ncbi:MAG: 2-oxo acid dehydrogenase subunit E2 [Bacteroidales bacterium]
MTNHRIETFPVSRIATIDIGGIGKRKHHVTGLIELDVTEGRKLIRDYNRNHPKKISFNAWLISTIARTIKNHDAATAFLKGRRRLMIFEDVNVSVAVEKEINNRKVPIPLVIEKAQEITISEITRLIAEARNKEITGRDIVLQKRSSRMENIYYRLPRFMRMTFWRYFLDHPKMSFKNMGNVAFTSIGTAGNVRGWFIPFSIHPVCFGISAIQKKPVAIGNKVEIREILPMTILLDHDVMDGAPMARFINELTGSIESGSGI